MEMATTTTTTTMAMTMMSPVDMRTLPELAAASFPHCAVRGNHVDPW